MVTAIILFKVGRNRVNEVAEQVAGIEEMSEVFSVTGSYDLVAIARIKTNDDLATLVTEQLGKVDGIDSTDTMLAFKAYSRHDLESMFSL